MYFLMYIINVTNMLDIRMRAEPNAYLRTYIIKLFHIFKGFFNVPSEVVMSWVL